jgi:hypothetical protein
VGLDSAGVRGPKAVLHRLGSQKAPTCPFSRTAWVEPAWWPLQSWDCTTVQPAGTLESPVVGGVGFASLVLVRGQLNQGEVGWF